MTDNSEEITPVHRRVAGMKVVVLQTDDDNIQIMSYTRGTAQSKAPGGDTDGSQKSIAMGTVMGDLGKIVLRISHKHTFGKN